MDTSDDKQITHNLSNNLDDSSLDDSFSEFDQIDDDRSPLDFLSRSELYNQSHSLPSKPQAKSSSSDIFGASNQDNLIPAAQAISELSSSPLTPSPSPTSLPSPQLPADPTPSYDFNPVLAAPLVEPLSTAANPIPELPLPQVQPDIIFTNTTPDLHAPVHSDDPILPPTQLNSSADSLNSPLSADDNLVSTVPTPDFPAKQEKIKEIQDNIAQIQNEVNDSQLSSITAQPADYSFTRFLLFIGPIFLTICLGISYYILNKKLENPLEILQMVMSE